MKPVLTGVTLTGADDSIHPNRLIDSASLSVLCG